MLHRISIGDFGTLWRDGYLFLELCIKCGSNISDNHSPVFTARCVCIAWTVFQGMKVPQKRKFRLWTFRSWEQNQQLAK